MCQLNVSNINECAGNPCLNSATCRNLENSYTCICSAGYTGRDFSTSEEYKHLIKTTWV